MHASDGWFNNSNVHLTKMRSVLLIRCLPKTSSSSSTSTGSQIATPPGGDLWREQRRNFSCELLHRRRRRCSSDHRQFISKPGSARYSSTPPLTTVWSNYQTLFNDFFEVHTTKMVTITKCSNCLTDQFNSVVPNRVINHSSLWPVVHLQ